MLCIQHSRYPGIVEGGRNRKRTKRMGAQGGSNFISQQSDQNSLSIKIHGCWLGK